MVRDLVAGAPHDAAPGAELLPVGGVGRQDAVLRVEQDVRLGQSLQVGGEFGQQLHGRWLGLAPGGVSKMAVILPIMANFWQNVGSLSGCFLQVIDLKRTFHSARGGMELVTLSHAKASVLEIFPFGNANPCHDPSILLAAATVAGGCDRVRLSLTCTFVSCMTPPAAS
jgi:hypothetical protein